MYNPCVSVQLLLTPHLSKHICLVGHRCPYITHVHLHGSILYIRFKSNIIYTYISSNLHIPTFLKTRLLVSIQRYWTKLPFKREADSSVKCICPSMSFGFSCDRRDFDFVQVSTLKSHMMKTHRGGWRSMSCGLSDFAPSLFHASQTFQAFQLPPAPRHMTSKHGANHIVRPHN